ncbi:MAG: signal recognition particle-docking protein FtsY [Bacteriovoracaceae bacterium]|nr:signal recognition particle-docking protein FtsY [Bacteriovoracaceae bacterium]
MNELNEYIGLAGLILTVGGSFYFLFFSKASSHQLVEPPKKEGKEDKEDKVVPAVKEEKVLEEKPKVEEKSWTQRLTAGLSKTRSEVWGKVTGLLGKSNLTTEEFEQIEEILYSSDLAPAMISELLERLEKEYNREGDDKDYLSLIKGFLAEKMNAAQAKTSDELYNFTESTGAPKVIMVVGVNGAGKTTTIGKLATKLKRQGAKVMVGACDTFRAAAVEQLEVWCQRAGVDIVKAQEGANPSGVAYETVEKAVKEKADYCIIDTAGRLHTAANLMEELAKTKRVMGKVMPDAPHEVLLVVDAITGQNALRQAQEFHKSLNLTGLIFTKCDGSSKAGSAVSIVNALDVPVTYIGVGENVEDLDRFEMNAYLDALLGLNNSEQVQI